MKNQILHLLAVNLTETITVLASDVVCLVTKGPWGKIYIRGYNQPFALSNEGIEQVIKAQEKFIAEIYREDER